MKSWKSKTKGWVTEEPEDWMIDRKQLMVRRSISEMKCLYMTVIGV